MSESARQLFDLVVTHRDPKTGLVTKQTPYILRVCGEQGSDQRSRMWERPAGSGNVFDRENNPVGRWIYEDQVIQGKKVRIGKHDPKAAHIEWAPPLTEDQKIAQENATLKAEIAALKAEQSQKDPTPTTKVETKKKDQGA